MAKSTWISRDNCDALHGAKMPVTVYIFFFFKQKTAYEMSVSDWSSDVCSSDLPSVELGGGRLPTIRTPELRTPEVELSRVEIPRIEIPSVQLPRVEIPRVEVPSVSLGGLRLPQIETPTIQTPRLDFELMAQPPFVRRRRRSPILRALMFVLGVGLGLAVGGLIAALLAPATGE